MPKISALNPTDFPSLEHFFAAAKDDETVKISIGQIRTLLKYKASEILASFEGADDTTVQEFLTFLNTQKIDSTTYNSDINSIAEAIDNKADETDLSDLSDQVVKIIVQALSDAQKQQARDNIGLNNNALLTAGDVLPCLRVTARPGTLKMNGALVSREAYADLYNYAVERAVITTEANWAASMWGGFGDGDGSTTFRLPDWRGEFVRGWDDGRGADPSRVFGQRQIDAYRAHAHTLSPTAGRVVYGGTSATVFGGGGGFSTDLSVLNSATSGGTETRPRNVTALWCIVY